MAAKGVSPGLGGRRRRRSGVVREEGRAFGGRERRKRLEGEERGRRRGQRGREWRGE